jgi:predicted aldo/keto reductase-like oxidoreductase
LQRLLKEAKELGTEFCRQCGYCLPCQTGIDIPTVFRLVSRHDLYDSAEWARQQYRSLAAKAADCEDCGECEKRCPYQLPIRKKLKKTGRKLADG